MTRPIQLTLIAMAVLIALVWGGFFAIGWNERKFASVVETIEVGASRHAVVERLGEPVSVGAECFVAQFVQFEKPSQRPVASYCAHWIGPSAGFKFYAVGFGPDDKVIWVAYGDS